MYRLKSITAAITLCCCSLSISAANEVTVFGAEGSNAAFNSGAVTRITFSASDFTLWQGASSQKSFALKDVTRISFGAGAGVAVISAPKGVEIDGPVSDLLRFRSLPADLSSSLLISSITGSQCLSLAEWKGDAVDVAHLPAGIYIASFLNTSIKFVKR